MKVSFTDRLRRSPTARRLRRAVRRVEPLLHRIGRLVAPEPFRSVSAARAATTIGNWPAAVRSWETAVGSRAQTRPVWHYEFARALANSGEPGRAADERQRALEHPAARAVDARRLAAAAASDDAWGYAAQAFLRAAEIDDDPATLVRAGQAFFQDGAMADAVRAFEQAIEELDDPPARAFAGLANALRKMGAFDRADTVADAGQARHPGSEQIAAARAWIASERRSWSEAAHRWPLAFAARSKRIPPRWIFRHGEALEQLGQHGHAVEVYDVALRRLERIDEPWAHWAILEWSFRRSYCLHRLGDPAYVDPALAVDLRSTTGLRSATGRVHGTFSADVSHLGLRLRGTVEDPTVASVDVLVDGVCVKQVDIDREGPRPEFAFTIRHAALWRFAPESCVSVRCARGLLASDTGGTTVDVCVPHGDGTLLERLGSVEIFTKKGALVPLAAADLSPERLLAAYTTVREFFADRLDTDLFLAYGTLLGCHRDGRFIPGDDDLDVGYLTTCTEPEQLKAETIKVMTEVIRAGFDVTTRHGGGLFKIWIGGIDIDVYPIWFHGGQAWGYDAIHAEPDDYEPARQTDFLGVGVLVPNRPDVLLRGTYGADWREPKPGFRYYRPKSVMNMLQRTCLTPSEAKRLLDDNAVARLIEPTLGTFEMHNGGAR